MRSLSLATSGERLRGKRQVWCLLQVKLCDPCLSALEWFVYHARCYTSAGIYLFLHEWGDWRMVGSLSPESGFDSLNCRAYWLIKATTTNAVRWCWTGDKHTQWTSIQHCGRHPDWQKKLCITRQCLKNLLIIKENLLKFLTVIYSFLWSLIILQFRTGHFCLKKQTWFAVTVISFIGLQCYTYNKNPIWLNPDPVAF